jgi:hypothetical protein
LLADSRPAAMHLDSPMRAVPNRSFEVNAGRIDGLQEI